MHEQVIKQTIRRAGWLAVLTALSAAPAAPAAHRRGRCAARITASFADSCRDFTAHSSRSLSYVDLHYVDGRVVRDQNIDGHDWAADGGPGDEIDFAKVRSGRTIEEFACEPTNGAPTALIEVQTPQIDQVLGHCYDYYDGLICEQSIPRPAWTSPAQVPDRGSEPGFLQWGCGGFSDPSLCSFNVEFRGIGSNDPDGDIASWSLDFGDGTSISGTWSAPPTEVAHAYPNGRANCVGAASGVDNVCVITLTVTDSVGQSDSETMLMIFIEQSPD